MLRPGELSRGVLDRDPVLARWAQHLPAADDRARALWVRRLIDRDVDEQPSAAQAAAWLDIKRNYLELRPTLRWVYACMRAREVHEPAMRRLGFRLLDAEPIRFSGRAFWTFVLDMGAGSVDGWLARLVGEEVDAGAGAPDADALLDEAAHEAVIDGERIALTPLEFGVLGYLRRRPGEAVTRHDLLESVWEHPPDAATSNVVEAVVRSLRRKLGRHAAVGRDRARGGLSLPGYGRASMTRLNGVCATTRTRSKPPACRRAASAAKPAWAPSPSWLPWWSAFCVHSAVDAA